jgi:hypothetical protein
MHMEMTGMEHSQDAPRRRTDRHLFFGIILIVFGTLLLVDRVLPVEFEHGWPFFVIALGVWKLIDPPRSGCVARSRRLGSWLLFIGCWGLLSSVHAFGMRYDISWPVLVVGAGLILVWRSFEGPDVPRGEKG